MSSGSPVVTSIRPSSRLSTSSGRGGRGAAGGGSDAHITSSGKFVFARRGRDWIFPVDGAGEQSEELEIDAEEESEVVR